MPLQNPDFDLTYFDKQPEVVTRASSERLSRFSIDLDLVPFPLDDSHRGDCIKALFDGLFAFVLRAGLKRNAITFKSKVSDLAQSTDSSLPQRQKQSWCDLEYEEPGKQFAILLSDTEFSIVSAKCRLSNAVYLACRVFQPLLELLLQPPLVDLLWIRDRVVSVDYAFNSQYLLLKHKINNSEPKNYEIVTRALSMTDAPSSVAKVAEHFAFPSLGVERHIRLDYNQHAIKTLRGKTFNTKIKVEAPYNEENSLLWIRTSLSAEEDFEFDIDTVIDTEVAMVDFYRDTILKRFLANLFCSIDYQSNETL